MSLFDYPKTYPPQINGTVSSTARLWCVGGFVWLVVALLLYIGSGLRMRFPEGLFMQEPWASTGVLNQMAESALIYGWGVSVVMGTALLQICRNYKMSLSPLVRVGAWVWHGGIFLALFILGSLSGSGIEGMPFPVWLWGILILGLLPTFGILTNGFLIEKQGLAEKLLYMAILTGMLILIVGVLFVFYGATEAFYRGLAAQAVRAGIVLCMLFGATWGFFLYEKDFSLRKKAIITLLFILFISVGLIFELAKDGMAFSQGAVVRPIAWFFFCCSLGLAVVRFFFKKEQGRYAFINFYFAIYLAYIIMGKYRGGLPLFSIILGIVTMGAFVPLYHLVPRCVGGDWLSLRTFKRSLVLASLLWGGGLAYDATYVFLLKRAAERGYPVNLGAWGMMGLALVGLAMVLPLLGQLALLWFTGGVRNTALTSFPFDSAKEKDGEIIDEKGNEK